MARADPPRDPAGRGDDAGGVPVAGAARFPEAPFAHALVLFGMGTGTLPTGLALLRLLDRRLPRVVARNAVIGATASVPFNAQVLIPLVAVPQWSQDTAAAVGIPLAGLVVHLGALVVSWRLFTPFRLLRPLASPWPPLAVPQGSRPALPETSPLPT